MKTGNFSHKIPSDKYCRVSIAVGDPKYGDKPDFKIDQLAPTWKLLNAFRNEMITEEEYVAQFNEQLSVLNPKGTLEAIKKACGDKEPVLLCHCGKQHFCHRHLVAEWLENGTGEKIEEFNYGETPRYHGRIIKGVKHSEEEPEQSLEWSLFG